MLHDLQRASSMMRLLPRALASVLISGALLLSPASLIAHGSVSSGSAASSFDEVLNEYRSRHGLGRVVLDAELIATAQAYAQDMAYHGHFSHTGRDWSNSGVRARRAGCTWQHVGENLGWGQTSEAEVIQGWAESAGHRGNLPVANFTRYGMARVGTYWVLMFADRC